MSENSLHIALIGCGQIGGSFALALHMAGADVKITGYDENIRHSETLLDMGAIDAIAASLTHAVKHADIVMLAVPLRSYKEIIHDIASHLEPHAIITDVGSVKSTMTAFKSTLASSVALVPAHPISGSEQSGPLAVRADLFQDKLCVLTPDADTSPEAVFAIESLWQSIGSTVRQMPAAIHDQLYAYVSHLPHVIAFVAARQFFAMGAHITPHDAVLARFLRISRSNPRMWTDIFIENSQAITQGLYSYLAILAHFSKELRQGDAGDKNASPVQVAKAVLPRILASSLISTVSLYEQQSDINARAFGAGGMRDIASPAADAPEDATAYISAHAAMVADIIDATMRFFSPVLSAIESADESALFALLHAMQQEAIAINAINATTAQ